MKNEKAFSLALGLCLALLASPAANSAIIQLRAHLSGAQEVPPNLATPAAGTGVMTFDTVTRQLTWSISYSGLQSAISDAHFHGPTPAGVDAGVQVPIGASASPLTGLATITVQQAADLLAGQYYINIHTASLPGGEIRGQVIPVRHDFNGDGRADILWRESASGLNAIWQMNGTTLAGSALITSVSAAGWTIAGQGDFDGDGKNDILWRNTTTGDNAIWLMEGFTLAGAALIASVPTSWSVAGVGDFNGDGKADILWRESSSGLNAIWQMNGTALTSSALITSVAAAGWNISGVGDFNGDGKADILWSNSATGDNAVWLMNGFTLASSALIASVPANWVIAGVGDFNGEGRADILWRNTSTGDNAIWLMNGTALASSALIPSVPTPWEIVGVGDYNGDGLRDILWRNTTTGDNAIWLMNGFNLASNALISPVPTSWSVAYGPDSGPSEPPELAGITLSHNQVRAQVQTATPLPALVWEPALAATAAAWAAQCVDQTAPSGLIDHNPNRSQGHPYYVGENIYGSSGNASAQQAVNLWAAEALNYNYANNTCTGVCGHYTQIVWRSTLKVGCALHVCPGLTYGHSIVCNYGPGGNTGGRPY